MCIKLKSSPHRAMIMNHGRLVTAEHRVGLRAGSQADLDGPPSRKVLARYHVEDELHVLVPMKALFVGSGRLRDVERKLHDGTINAPLVGKDSRQLHMVALNEQKRVG